MTEGRIEFEHRYYAFNENGKPAGAVVMTFMNEGVPLLAQTFDFVHDRWREDDNVMRYFVLGGAARELVRVPWLYIVANTASFDGFETTYFGEVTFDEDEEPGQRSAVGIGI